MAEANQQNTDASPEPKHRPETAPIAMHGTNLAHLVSRRRILLRLLGAISSGLLLSAAFPPLELDLLVWIALVPILLVPSPATLPRRLLLGYLFGYTHYVTNLAWLNEVGFGAGFLLALYCALYPMLWYVMSSALLRWQSEVLCDVIPQPSAMTVRGAFRQCLLVLLLPGLWVGLEWVRGWLFTGFPWNGLGVSQWQRSSLLALVPFTGVAGLSLLIVVVNVAVAFTVCGWILQFRERGRRPFSAPLLIAVLLCVCMVLARHISRPLPPADDVLTVLAVQGNIPQCREYTMAEFREARDTYLELTRRYVPVTSPDLVIWPETAVPAGYSYLPYRMALEQLQEETRTLLLLGVVDYRPLPGAVQTNRGWEPPALVFNTALLLGEAGDRVDYYDKIHRVPFGEFTPFGDYLPWLVEMIGMGRDLTPGSEFTVFSLPHGARGGVNICFEDAFPYISRRFVKNGANLLITITNDAWYATSSGSRQHMTHAVFRAAENRRPLLRSGNNSDTCLIMPDGSVQDLLYDGETGNRFIRAARSYRVPIWSKPQLTFFARHGDWLGRFCGLLWFVALIMLVAREIWRRQRLHERISCPAT